MTHTLEFTTNIGRDGDFAVLVMADITPGFVGEPAEIDYMTVLIPGTTAKAILPSDALTRQEWDALADEALTRFSDMQQAERTEQGVRRSLDKYYQ